MSELWSMTFPSMRCWYRGESAIITCPNNEWHKRWEDCPTSEMVLKQPPNHGNADDSQCNEEVRSSYWWRIAECKGHEYEYNGTSTVLFVCR